MNQHQIELAMALIKAMESDEVAQADCSIYGDWFEHLTDHLSDIAIED